VAPLVISLPADLIKQQQQQQNYDDNLSTFPSTTNRLLSFKNKETDVTTENGITKISFQSEQDLNDINVKDFHLPQVLINNHKLNPKQVEITNYANHLNSNEINTVYTLSFKSSDIIANNNDAIKIDNNNNNRDDENSDDDFKSSLLFNENFYDRYSPINAYST
jgi:hypothetical protein